MLEFYGNIAVQTEEIRKILTWEKRICLLPDLLCPSAFKIVKKEEQLFLIDANPKI